MDPAPSRLAAILTIEQLFEEAGVRTPLREGVLGALGDPTTVREVAFVSDEDWQGLAATLLFSPGTEQGVEGPSTAPVALTPVQKSRVRYLQRVARLVAGLPVERERPLPEVSAAPPPPSKRVGLSSLVDPSAEAELVNLDSSVVRTMFSSYKDKRGAFPHKDHEPTEEQLSAVAQLLGAGQAPYVDFALFGPHGKRALKKLTMVAFTYQVESGTWKRIEVPGPPDFATWWRCWLVFKTTLLLLGCVSTERLEHYGEFMRHLCETYGHEVWFIIAQADDRFRSEEMERLRRTAQIPYESTSEDARATSVFQPDRPWEWAFGAALGDQGRDFWDSEVLEGSLLPHKAKDSRRDLGGRHNSVLLLGQAGVQERGLRQPGPEPGCGSAPQEEEGEEEKAQRLKGDLHQVPARELFGAVPPRAAPRPCGPGQDGGWRGTAQGQGKRQRV